MRISRITEMVESKPNLENIKKFIRSVSSPEVIEQMRARTGYGYKKNQFNKIPDTPITHDEGINFIRNVYELHEQKKSPLQNRYRNYENVLPFDVVDHDPTWDTDHDHGAWTERYIIEYQNKFYEICFDFYGQGEHDDDNNSLREVKPKTITKVVYE